MKDYLDLRIYRYEFTKTKLPPAGHYRFKGYLPFFNGKGGITHPAPMWWGYSTNMRCED